MTGPAQWTLDTLSQAAGSSVGPGETARVTRVATVQLSACAQPWIRGLPKPGSRFCCRRLCTPFEEGSTYEIRRKREQAGQARHVAD